MRWLWLTVFLILMGGVFTWARLADVKANRDWKTVERLMGHSGRSEGDGFKIKVPRSDLNVLVHGSWVDPRAGLNSWFSFKPLARGCLLTGELVLVDWEAPRAESLLASYQLTLTSIFRPFNGENPGIECVDFTGKGPRILLAQEARTLLAATSMPMTPPPPAANPPTAAQTAFNLSLEKLLGPATWEGETLNFSFVSSEPVMREGIEIPSYMGLETMFHFQPDGKQTKVYGQWVISPAETQDVLESLMKNNIGITNIHSGPLNQSPQMVYVDFWTEGEPIKIAKFLKEAVKTTRLTGQILESPK
jgi:hypothetical protein